MFPWIALFEILKREKPDILHIETDLLCLSAFQLILLNRLTTRARTVFFSWENLYHRHRPIRRFVEHHTIHNADHLIAGNRDAKDVLTRKGIPPERISIMPQIGVTPGRAQTGYPHHASGPFTLGFVGRLIEEKGVFTLLDAFADLPADCQLLMVGDGSARRAFAERTERLGVVSRVELTGSVPFHNVHDYLRRMDVLVLPSLTTRLWAEQFGHVLVEAMVLGIPVVGSDSGAIPEVIGDAGLIFPEGEAAALTERLRRLADSPALRLELSRLGEDRCRRLYTHARIAEGTHEIYCSLLR
jgi:glycosyltransferase involved in cell wall biosynthesis